MKRLILVLVSAMALCIANPALAAPTVSTGPGAKSSQTFVKILIGDTADSRAIPTDGICTARVNIVASDVVELWGVNDPATAATSGTQIGSDFTTSTEVNAPYTWKAGTTHVKVKGTTATAGGSTVLIDCNPITGAGGGGVTLVAAADLPATGDESITYRITDADDSADCDSSGGGTEQADCRWNGSAYEPIGVAATGLTNPLTADLDGDGNDLVDLGRISATGATKTISYSSAKSCYFLDINGDGVFDTEGATAMTAEHCISDREVWTDQFMLSTNDTSGEAATVRHGLQAAIDSVCTAVDTNAKTGRGGIVNIPAGYYDFSDNYINVPTLCRGLVIRGQGNGSRFGGTAASTGTILRFDLTGGADAITFAATNQHWRVENITFQFSNQTSGSRVLAIGDQNDHWVVDGIYTIAQSANIETGAAIEFTNAQNFDIKNSRLEGFGTGVRGLGSDGDGGGRIHGNIIRGADTTGVGQAGIYMVDGRPFSEVTIFDNIIETGNVGVDLGITTAGNGGIASIRDNYFENSAGTGEINIRINGYVVPTVSGNGLYPSSATPYRRTAGTGITGAVDTFYGNRFLNSIVMDAGACVVYGIGAAASDANTAACASGEMPLRSAFPSNPVAGMMVAITDDSATGACDSAAGTADSLCIYNGSSWVAIGDGSATAGGDITEIGNSSVGAVCSSGACFEGVGTEDNLAGTGDFKIRVDYDNNGTNAFTIQNGSGSTIGQFTESGTAPSVLNGSFGAYNALFGVGAVANSTLQVGTASSDGTLRLRNSSGGNQAIVAGATGTYTLTLPLNDGSPDEVLSTDGSGVLDWVPQSSISGWTDGTTILYPDSATADVAIGGTDSTAAFFFDESAGVLNINVAGGSIDIDAHPTDGGALSVKEGADDGTDVWTMKAPDGGLDASKTCTMSADGLMPPACGATGFDSSSSTGVAVVASGVWDVDATPALGTPSALVLTNATGLPVPGGGTGAATFTANGAIYGNGTSAMQVTAAHTTNGSLLIGDGSGVPTVATITGTANEITVTNGAGSITLDIPNSPVFVTPNIGTATGTGLDVGTGVVRGAVCNERDTAANIATGFAAGDMEGCWFYIVSGTDTITLPAITADGQSACFYALGANAITINPDDADQIRRADGTLQTAGVTLVSAATAGTFGCFMSSNSSGADDEWILLGNRNTWSVGS